MPPEGLIRSTKNTCARVQSINMLFLSLRRRTILGFGLVIAISANSDDGCNIYSWGLNHGLLDQSMAKPFKQKVLQSQQLVLHISTLAPKVWTVSTDGPYTTKIDAIGEIPVQRHSGSNCVYTNDPITRDRHSKILNMLRAHCSKGTEDESLVDLVSKLLFMEARGTKGQQIEPCSMTAGVQLHKRRARRASLRQDSPKLRELSSKI